MNADIVEEIVTDWHRFGNHDGVPWTHLSRLISYFKRFPTDKYSTYHLKTAIYFIDYTIQVEYWIVIRILLEELSRVETNIIVRTIEDNIKRSLSAKDRIYYGHVILVDLGYPLCTVRERHAFVNLCTEFPNAFIQHFVAFILFLYRRKHTDTEYPSDRRTCSTSQVLPNSDD